MPWIVTANALWSRRGSSLVTSAMTLFFFNIFFSFVFL
jgi:hypothetical protein